VTSPSGSRACARRFVTVLGARPQFVKAGPLSLALRARATEIIVHTGQHYDPSMSDVFFEELALPRPDYNLGIGGGGQGAQTGAMLEATERVLEAERPDAVIVYGDTNSTLAGALAAAKLHIPVAHVEAGLRSFNRRMPEEINRVLTDHVSTWLFAPSTASATLLAAEGILHGVHVVGDIMKDAVNAHLPRARERSTVLERLGLTSGEFVVATIHRAENTDYPSRLASLLGALGALGRRVVLPLHPRTASRLASLGLSCPPSVSLVQPVGYLDMLRLVVEAACVATDSGGLQKEAFYAGTPCVTLRTETEWKETVDAGWNMLCEPSAAALTAAVARMTRPRPPAPELYGDGHAARRIVDLLLPPE
jgi:UDP-GlcNAc3NAcA epimerase